MLITQTEILLAIHRHTSLTVCCVRHHFLSVYAYAHIVSFPNEQLLGTRLALTLVCTKGVGVFLGAYGIVSFTVQQRCKHLSCLLFTSVYNLSFFVYLCLLTVYLLTVNVNALKTVPSEYLETSNKPICLVQCLQPWYKLLMIM